MSKLRNGLGSVGVQPTSIALLRGLVAATTILGIFAVSSSADCTAYVTQANPEFSKSNLSASNILNFATTDSLIAFPDSLVIAAAKGSEHKIPVDKNDDAESVPVPAGIDMDMLEKLLKGNGLTGEIHAADADNRQFVLTYRDPKDFFNNIQLVMVSHDKTVLEFFQKINRHDRVTVKGEFFHQGEFFPESPQPHIEVASIAMVKPYQALQLASGKFHKEAKLPDELKDKTEADFLVHAVVKKGASVVLEYKDNFVFVVVPDKRFSENLFRNDRIHMRYKIQSFPTRPTHLELDPDTSNGKVPVKVLDSIHSLHGKQLTQEGSLVRFPKSPQINRDIWAIEQKGEDGNSRTFTLVNFVKKGEQEKIDAKLKAWWDATPDGVIDGRNKLLQTKLKIRATGKMNVVDPNQANAQMQLRAKDLVKL